MSDKVSKVTKFEFGTTEDGKPQLVCTADFHVPTIKKFLVIPTVHGDVPRFTMVNQALHLAVMMAASWLAKGNRMEHPLDEMILEETHHVQPGTSTGAWDYPDLNEERAARLDLATSIEIHSFHKPDTERLEYILTGVFAKVWINGLAYRGYGHEGKPFNDQIHEALLTALDSRRCEDL